MSLLESRRLSIRRKSSSAEYWMENFDDLVDYFVNKENVEVIESSSPDILEYALEEETRYAYHVSNPTRRL